MAKYLVKKICTSGDCVEEFYSFSGRERLTRGQRKRGASDLRKVDSNFKSAVRRLARTLNCNFTHGDLLVTLDYADIEGKTREDFNKDCELMLRRLRYQCRKNGTEFKWVWVFGEISTHTGLPSRPHHHIVMPRFAYETVVKNWTYGSVNYRLLQNQKDYTKLALYLLRNVDKNIPDAKKYRTSRNMKKPEWDEVRVKKLQPIRIPKNAQVQARGEYDPSRYNDYVRYTKN